MALALSSVPLIVLLLFLVSCNDAVIFARPVSTAPVSCPAGFERVSLSGKLLCKACQAGFYQGSPGTSPCTRCPPGSYSNTSATSCKLCSPGSYSSRSGTAFSCLKCPRGTYASGTAAVACTPCRAGLVTAHSGSSQCVCPAGTGYRAGNSSCLPCARGTYNPGDSLQCRSCPVGWYIFLHRATSCRRCKTGLTTLGPQSVSYTQCACPPGTQYRTKTKQCDMDCPPGSFNNGTLQVCRKCLIGSYAPSPASSSCVACTPGFTTMSTGSTARDACVCPSNTSYNPVTQSCGADAAPSFPSDCPQNTYYDVPSHSCEACPGDTTTSGPGGFPLNQCACPAGTTFNDNTQACDTDCPPGTFNDGSLQVCRKCPKGTYAASSASSSCNSCGRGISTNSIGSTSGVACVCPSGQQYNANMQSCGMATVSPAPQNPGVPSSCPQGSYLDGALQSCQGCPSGMSTNGPGATSSKQCSCPAGTQFNKNTQACDMDCPPGSFNDGSLQLCTKCLVGTYASSPGASSCDTCGSGIVTKSTGSASSSACVCPSGQLYSADTQSCVAAAKPQGPTGCSQGSYYDRASQSCQGCPSGMSTSGPGATSPAQCGCPAGQAADAASGSCMACPQGWYKAKFGPQACTECPGVYTTDGTGSTSATACGCPAGTYLSGKDTCTMCTLGFYNPHAGATSVGSCIACGGGMTTLDTGKSLPSDCVCGPGYFGSADLGGCTVCDQGTYSSDPGSPSCTSCDTGYTVDSGSSSKSSCVCPAGVGWDGSGCNPCSGDSFNDGTFKQCQPCPDGMSPSGANDSCG